MSSSDYKIYSTTADAWAAMLASIKAAQKSIYWEVYILADDAIGKQFFTILEEKAAAGIDVKLIVDYWGSFWLSRKRVQELRDKGIDIRVFQDSKRRRLIWWGLMSSRTHRKILIVDEKIGFVGGVNVQRSMEDWLDIHVALRGKAVRSLLRSFAKSYIMCGGDKQAVSSFVDYKRRLEHSTIDIIADQPHLSTSKVKKTYIEALLRARERVILFSPYYFPDRHFLAALWKAKKKGIRVDLLIPFRTDMRIATYAAYTWFSLMRAWGVTVHLMPKMMHGKGVIVDDDWAMIGSSNIDQTSFHYNHELNIGLHNKRIVGKLKRIALGWIKDSRPLGEEWEKRGNWQKIKEWVALKLYRFWFGAE